MARLPRALVAEPRPRRTEATADRLPERLAVAWREGAEELVRAARPEAPARVEVVVVARDAVVRADGRVAVGRTAA